MDDAALLRFVEVSRAIKAHEDDIGALKEERAALEASLLENMIAVGTQRITVNGATVYIKRELWAGAGEQGMVALVAGLRKEGLGDLVQESAGSAKLSAWIREHDPEKRDPPDVVVSRLPEAIRPLVKVSEKFGLHVVKA